MTFRVIGSAVTATTFSFVSTSPFLFRGESSPSKVPPEASSSMILEPDGYDHNWHPQHTCDIEEVAHPRVHAGQCPIREQITHALDQRCIARPNTGQHIGV
jgi:hypothetical protein